MGRVRGRRLRFWPIAAAMLAAAGLAAWLLRGGDAGTGESPEPGRAAQAPEGEGPVLVTPPGAGARGPDAGAAPVGEPALAGVALEAPREERIELRLVDRHGRPLSFARVTVRVAVTDARGTRSVASSAQADEDGRVKFDVPSRRVLALEVAVAGRRDGQVVASFDGGEDAALLERADLVAQGLEVLRVRTVDGRGRGIADRRIVFRPWVEGVEPSGWWGDRSDMSALLVIGPFPSGSWVEIAPGPGSTSDTQREPGPWQRVRVDGSMVEVNVGDGPRLRLRIAGVASNAEIEINGRTTRLEGGIWTGPEVDPRLGMDVWVGPLPDGRFAALRSLFAEVEPIDVELESGTRVTGRLTGGPASARWSGSVTARGERWSARVAVGDDGTFSFPGLPTARGGVLLHMEGTAAPSGQGYVAEMLWKGEAHVDPAVKAAVALRGRLLFEDPSLRPLHFEVAASVWGFRSEWDAAVESDGTFRVVVPAGYCQFGAFAHFETGAVSHGHLDLGVLAADRSDIVIPMQPLE